jgi:hypothetical protein
MLDHFAVQCLALAFAMRLCTLRPCTGPHHRSSPPVLTTWMKLWCSLRSSSRFCEARGLAKALVPQQFCHLIVEVLDPVAHAQSHILAPWHALS